MIIGAGVSGICVGYFFKLMNLDFVILEKGSEIGGTWFWNKYPGAGCDVQSHIYSFSFNQKRDWSKAFCLSEEIQDYLLQTWKWAKLVQHTQFNTEGKLFLIDRQCSLF